MLTLDIALLDGTTQQVTAQAVDFVAWEGKFDLSVAQFNKNMKLTHLLFLGWHTLKRTKVTDLEFESWLELVQNVSVVESKK